MGRELLAMESVVVYRNIQITQLTQLTSYRLPAAGWRGCRRRRSDCRRWGSGG
jgi:hypothetical protein